ncbi:hypothetical protein [Kiloniella majae]|uniref:hypothetical protein n=1 Tax=Kiloniella majae TaxID=1938558 RepID=UPI000A278525|nr:hypothetical protein [Kiloniella majae]
MSELTIPKQPTQSVPNVSPQSAASRQKVPTSSVNAASLAPMLVSVDRSSAVSSHANGRPGAQISQPLNSGEVVVASLASNIMTYRDSESGRLVVRLIDEDNNAVISEFPSKTMLGNYPKQSAFPLEENAGLDTKA